MPISVFTNASFSEEIASKGRNLVINGAMTVAQRGTSVTNVSSGGYKVVDRFRQTNNASFDQFQATHEQSTDAPTGFNKSYKITVTTAETSLDADERLRIQHRMEGSTLASLKFGTNESKDFTLSFYVKSNLTGTYAVLINGMDHSPKRIIGATYTIDSANTWEKKAMTFPGPGTFVDIFDDTSESLRISWILANGSDYYGGTFPTSNWVASTTNNEGVNQANLIATANNFFAITGVQLEAGSETAFEHESYADTLLKCQRYLYAQARYLDGNIASGDANGATRMFSSRYSSGGSFVRGQYPVMMRANPDLTYSISGGTVSADFSNAGGFQLYDSDDTAFYIHSFIADAEL